jgi:CheY-like chemotaxis protein
VIGLTAYALSEEREKCNAAGMVEVVTKPINVKVLVEAIRTQVHRRNPLLPLDDVVAQVHSASPGLSGPVQGSPRAVGPIDWPALLQHYGGRHDFVKKLATSMRLHYADTPRLLRAAGQDGDRKALAAIAHSLKGVNLEASRLRELTLAFEADERGGGPLTAQRIEAVAAALEAVLLEMAVVDQPQWGT